MTEYLSLLELLKERLKKKEQKINYWLNLNIQEKIKKTEKEIKKLQLLIKEQEEKIRQLGQ
jgi:hypothetical protein